jgi:hypothetical protein
MAHLRNPLAVRWHGAATRFVRLLARHPHDRRAWLWQVRVKVLAFMLSRYGWRRGLGTAQRRPPAPCRIDVLTHPVSPRLSGVAMRRLLADVERANRRCKHAPGWRAVPR